MMDRKQHIKRIFWLLGSIAFIIGTMLVFTAFGYHGDRTIADVEMHFEKQPNAENLLDSAEVIRVVHSLYPNGLAGRSVKYTMIDSLEAAFRANPFVKDVEVYADKNAVVRIDIEERRPLFRLLTLKGDNGYVDYSGELMPLSPNYTARVIVVTGHLPKLKASDGVDSVQILKKVYTIAQAIEKDDFMKDFITEIHVDHQSKISLVPLLGEFRISIKDVEEIEEKIENLKIFLRDGLSRVGWNKYSEIIIDYNHQIVGKKNVKP